MPEFPLGRRRAARSRRGGAASKTKTGSCAAKRRACETDLTAALTRFADLVTVTGPGGGPLYCCGRKDPEIRYDDPSSWVEGEEQIDMRALRPLMQPCSIEEVVNAEIHFENRTFRLIRSTRTMCAQVHQGIVVYYYFFEEGFAEDTQLLLVVRYGPLPERASALNIYMDNGALTFETNPTRFQNDEIPNVWFDHLAFLYTPPSEADEEAAA